MPFSINQICPELHGGNRQEQCGNCATESIVISVFTSPVGCGTGSDSVLKHEQKELFQLLSTSNYESLNVLELFYLEAIT